MRTIKGKRVPPTKSPNKLAAVSALHETLGSWSAMDEIAITCVAAGVPCC